MHQQPSCTGSRQKVAPHSNSGRHLSTPTRQMHLRVDAALTPALTGVLVPASRARRRRHTGPTCSILSFSCGLLLALAEPKAAKSQQQCTGGGTCSNQQNQGACCSQGSGCQWNGASCSGAPPGPPNSGGGQQCTGGGTCSNQQNQGACCSQGSGCQWNGAPGPCSGANSNPSHDCDGLGDCTTRTSRSTCCDLQRGGSCTWNRQGDSGCGGQGTSGPSPPNNVTGQNQAAAGVAKCSSETIILDPVDDQFLTLDVYERLPIQPQAGLDADSDGVTRMNQISTTCRGCQCPDGVAPDSYGHSRGDDSIGFKCRDGSAPDTSITSCCIEGDVCAAGIPPCSSCCHPCRFGTLSKTLNEFPLSAADMAAATAQQGANGPIQQTYNAVYSGDEPVCLYGKAAAVDMCAMGVLVSDEC
eukprot:COSAG01_NODE_5060_length_4518_cov_47.000000_1_plen_414_part_00